MRIGGRLQAAIEILTDIEARHRPAADALKDWALNHRFAGSGDRGAIGNIVYDALRRRRSAGWLLGAETPRAQAFGALLLEGGWQAEALDAALTGDKFAPPPLTPEEKGALASRRLPDAPPAVRADAPDWCAPLLEAVFGEAWVEEGAAMAARPPLDLRVNALLATRDKVLRPLAEFAGAPAPIAPHGVRIPPIQGGGRHPNVQAEPAFQQGWFEVQDEGSQLAADLAGAKPGEAVLDFCAGAGGKTLALAADMRNEGRITAFDAEKARLAPIFDRLRRADVRNVEVAARRGELSELEGRMDLVLVDAPCTGSGTWRRRPDAKWRLSPRQLDLRRAEQTAILDDAARFVRPGGRLAFITCSVFAEENAAQVEALVSRRPEFVPADHAQLWTENFPDAAGRARIGAHGLQLSPALTGTDGFFFALLRREGSS
ncbi:MAG TPA: RsmB/NOP family class I SAM-dependent RNA methyltransferase [Mesorhizobium sp.]|jgi:16S rRNA (cytosine967-C5)-methyltransferase|nr:RsmB/NOP family class I SAM-dependent RNA methyltransferase [Mesorhizobium sp.]